jgi:hypothetical protein
MKMSEMMMKKKEMTMMETKSMTMRKRVVITTSENLLELITLCQIYLPI